MSTVAPAYPTQGRAAGDVNLMTGSPSQELALSLAGIRLDDGEEEGGEGGTPLPLLLQDVSSKLSLVREQFFIVQERRHAGVFALTEHASSSEQASSPRWEEEGAEKSIALDIAMAQLNGLFEAISEAMRAAEEQVNVLCEREEGMGKGARRRRGSGASMDSLDSFDDAFLDMSSSENDPDMLKKRYQDLSTQWASVQVEAKNLEEELSGDKYLLVFSSISEQMEGMMESLDKALASCHDFVFAYHKDRAERLLSTSSPSQQSHWSAAQWSSAEERLNELKMVKRSFDVKKSSYGPACEQMFISLEKGVKQRSTRNGTILRKFAELKTRWRGLREKVSKMDRDLKQIEEELHGNEIGRNAVGQMALEQTLTPTRDSGRPRSRLRGKNDSATTTPTSMNRSISVDDLYGEAKALSPANLNSGRLLYPTEATKSPPSKPPKSVHRRSVISNQQMHSRSVSSTAVPIPSARTSSRYIVSPSSYARPTPTETHHLSGTPHHEQPLRAGSEPPSQHDGVSRWNYPELPPGMIGEEREESLLDVGDASFSSLNSAYKRPASVSGLYNRPASATGSYYRPPTSSGHRSDAEGNSSRIPRLATGARQPNDALSSASNANERPGSSMSHSSSTAYGRSPSAKHSFARAQHPPSSFYSSDRGNRMSMQTPEPTIAARVRRMNMFAPKQTPTSMTASKRSSRPPPAKYNAAVYGPSSNGSSFAPTSPASNTTSPSNSRTLSNTQPLQINKRNSLVWSGNATGRTTPLSAAALAKLPSAMHELGNPGQRNPSGSSAASTSVANFRSQRAAISSGSSYEYGGGGTYTPTVLSGRETPTFSEGGGSSVWGGGPSRRLAAVYSYRPNPNDALDVEVASVVNSLGMAIERIDAPLPKGVKEMNPSSTKTVKYEVGGKVIVCKLLQLHRPASVASNQDKTNKVLTRVGGGWIDLRQYLLSRLGTA